MNAISKRSLLAATGLLLLAGSQAAQRRADLREIHVPGKSSVIRTWTENGSTRYAIALDGKHFAPSQKADYDLLLRFERFDPVKKAADVPSSLLATPANRLYVVQYITQGIEDYRDLVRAEGGTIHRFLANNANIVEMDRDAVQAIRALPFVRSVSPFQPAFKLEEELVRSVQNGETGPLRVNILTMERGGYAGVTNFIESAGGTIHEVTDRAYLMVATLDASLLPQLASRNDVAWIDRAFTEVQTDMDIARVFHGTDYISGLSGYSGQDMRVEVRDVGCSTQHQDMPNFLLHGTVTGTFHGTSTSGIVLGKGIGRAAATGCMPDAFLVIQDIDTPTPGGSRYNASAEVQDPAGPYRCVIQSNSVSNSRTLNYTSVSQNMDLILFDFPRFSVCQSQSNANNQMSRPEAWAKNIIAVGGINHRGTVSKNDDFWGGASIGPAADGRIKPDLASFYDRIQTTDGLNGYTNNFGGTSGATPIVAGNLGYFYQMWSNGDFGNPVPGTTPFENAPFNTTAKAVLINTAQQWTFSGTTSNLTRTHQGWGAPDLQYMWDHRAKTLIVDETDVLSLFDTTTYYVNVLAGSPELRATMVYRDLPGTTSSTLHRINDLDLIAIDPNGVVWKGNRGLDAGNYSLPGGKRNKIDTVENLFIQNPAAGQWRIMVRAAEINGDSHEETPAVDADYALVVTGHDSVDATCQAASVSMRNAGPNLNALTATNPVIGQQVTFTVDTMGRGFARVIGCALPEMRLVDNGSVALVNPETQMFVSGRIAGPTAVYQNTVANSMAMCGITIYCQALLDDGPGTSFVLTNSVDLRVGN
ncbi:MAG TPA: peptidase S8 [Planctomycetes bacterium]|nr:peptidase S8 [Planctomycetota bacterium]